MRKSRLRRNVALAAALAGAVAAVVIVHSRTPSNHAIAPATPADPSVDAVAPSARLLLPTQPPEYHRGDMEAVANDVDHSPARETAAAEAPVSARFPDPTAAFEEHRSHVEALAARLDDEVQNQPPDPAWSPELDIAAYLERAAPGSRVISTQCSANVCRVEVWHMNPDGKDSFPSKLDPRLSMPGVYIAGRKPDPGTEAFAGGTLINPYTNSPAVTHLYVSRPGYHFGEPPPPKLPPLLDAAIKARADMLAAERANSAARQRENVPRQR